ncbi:MAG: hypothetical protein ACRBFS_04720 [Aureispira sp.]
MKFFQLIFISGITFLSFNNLYGQGFATTPTNWTVPLGGAINSSGHAHGFNNTVSGLSYINNDEGWVTQDINGDGLLDLVVTGIGNGSTGDVFGNGTTPY